MVFTYLDAFDGDEAAVAELKAHYRRGGLGDMAVKKRLESVLQELLAPTRERRAAYARDQAYVLDVLRDGANKARAARARRRRRLRADRPSGLSAMTRYRKRVPRAGPASIEDRRRRTPRQAPPRVLPWHSLHRRTACGQTHGQGVSGVSSSASFHGPAWHRTLPAP